MRWELANALAAPEATVKAAIIKQVKSTGLGPLNLYVAAGSAGPGGTESRHHLAAASEEGFARELVAILRVCQTASRRGRTAQARVRAGAPASARGVGRLCRGPRRRWRMRSPQMDRGSDGAIARARASTPGSPSRRTASATVSRRRRRSTTAARRSARCARDGRSGSTHDTSRAGAVLTMSAAAAAPMLAAVAGAASDADSRRRASCSASRRRSSNCGRASSARRRRRFAVLIDGESGSGKELVARAIHRGSARRHKPFCTLNCAALPDDLVEAELFGHSRGAFTGAVADRAGVFEEAHGGTLFLDEIGELTPRAQAKVLRVIQEGELRRVGENVVAARRRPHRLGDQSRRCGSEVEAGRFRLDLLYRLDVVHITVPPLRERREDIAVLAEHFWRERRRASAAARRSAPRRLRRWRATTGRATCASCRTCSPRWRCAARSAASSRRRRCRRRLASAGRRRRWRLDEARRTFEERFVRAALVRTGGHRGRAAAELGVTRQGLTKLMTRLGNSDVGIGIQNWREFRMISVPNR